MSSRSHLYGDCDLIGAVISSGYEQRLEDTLFEFNSWLLYLVAKLFAPLDLKFSVSILGMMIAFFS